MIPGLQILNPQSWDWENQSLILHSVHNGNVRIGYVFLSSTVVAGGRYWAATFIARRYASAVYAMGLCLSVRPSVFHFLAVGSVRYIKLTYVTFGAHVKTASRIVSYPSVTSRISTKMAKRGSWQLTPPVLGARP